MIFFFVNTHFNVFFDLKIWLANNNTLTSARGYACAVYLLSFMPKRKISKRAPLGKREGGCPHPTTPPPPLPLATVRPWFSFENCMYLKLSWFSLPQFDLFSGKNYKITTKYKFFLSKLFISVIFYWNILQFNFMKLLNLKILGLSYWAWINFMIY